MESDKFGVQARRHSFRTGSGGLIIGGAIVAIGLVLLLENMGILREVRMWDYWPLILVALGLGRIAESQRPAAMVWGGLLAGAGVLFLLRNLDILRVDFRMIWPLLIIGFGVSMLLRAMDRGRLISGQMVDSDPTISLYAIFGGSKRRIDSPDFRGGEVFALFGGFHIDLRGSQMPSLHGALDVNTMFGGCEIIVPETWRINMKGAGIFGGFEDRSQPVRPVEGVIAPELVVTGTALFGGVTVRN